MWVEGGRKWKSEREVEERNERWSDRESAREKLDFVSC